MYLQHLGKEEFVIRIFYAEICQLIFFFVCELLINNLVDMARLNAGHIQPQRVEADMNKVITESVERWKTANPAKPVRKIFLRPM